MLCSTHSVINEDLKITQKLTCIMHVDLLQASSVFNKNYEIIIKIHIGRDVYIFQVLMSSETFP